ncbi:hypothetical protein, partial [Yersinia pseudotuberculosis]|uniref:hypothetical protein n=1 Tax=Yersinia pseudotuberculosis TaxID=633 RepID=UPI001E54B054
ADRASAFANFNDAHTVVVITHGLTLCWLRVESMVTAICAGGEWHNEKTIKRVTTLRDIEWLPLTGK